LLKSYADLSNTSYFGSGSTTRYNPPAINNVNPPVIANSGLNNPVSNLNGFFYSVQVGVYARPVTSAQLFNISPLNDEKMANGYYRYISGTFQNVKDAIAAKNEIVRKGVTDAFVVAYNNGKQISLVEARGLAGNNITPPQNNNPVITNNTETATSSDDKTGIEFKVQLGAFAKDVPIEVVNKLLELVTGNGLEHGKNDEGLTVFTTGHFKDFRSADDYKSSLVENGIKDAFVVAFQHGNKISVTKAIELTK